MSILDSYNAYFAIEICLNRNTFQNHIVERIINEKVFYDYNVCNVIDGWLL